MVAHTVRPVSNLHPLQWFVSYCASTTSTWVSGVLWLILLQTEFYLNTYTNLSSSINWAQWYPEYFSSTTTSADLKSEESDYDWVEWSRTFVKTNYPGLVRGAVQYGHRLGERWADVLLWVQFNSVSHMTSSRQTQSMPNFDNLYTITWLLWILHVWSVIVLRVVASMSQIKK